jgi:hypothetical protein
MAPQDIELLVYLQSCRELEVLGIGLSRGEHYGVLVHDGAHTVGLWSFYEGRYRWRYLASYEPITSVGSIEEARLLTLRMAHRRAWSNPRGSPA